MRARSADVGAERGRRSRKALQATNFRVRSRDAMSSRVPRRLVASQSRVQAAARMRPSLIPTPPKLKNSKRRQADEPYSGISELKIPGGSFGNGPEGRGKEQRLGSHRGDDDAPSADFASARGCCHIAVAVCRARCKFFCSGSSQRVPRTTLGGNLPLS